MQNSPSLSISPQNYTFLYTFLIFENYLNKNKMQRLEHFNILIVGQLNISPIRNKFESKIDGGLMFYSNEETSCKLLNNYPIVPNAELTCIEFYQTKRKWLLLGCYKPPTQSDLEFIASVTKIVDFYFNEFEKLFIIGDVNMMTENTHLSNLLHIYDLTALIKEPTCNHSQNPNCIDHFLNNRKTLFVKLLKLISQTITN